MCKPRVSNNDRVLRNVHTLISIIGDNLVRQTDRRDRIPPNTHNQDTGLRAQFLPQLMILTSSFRARHIVRMGVTHDR